MHKWEKLKEDTAPPGGEARRGLTVCVGVGHLLVCHHSRRGVVHLSEATNQSQSRPPDRRTYSKNKTAATNKQNKQTSGRPAVHRGDSSRLVSKLIRGKKETKKERNNKAWNLSPLSPVTRFKTLNEPITEQRAEGGERGEGTCINNHPQVERKKNRLTSFQIRKTVETK